MLSTKLKPEQHAPFHIYTAKERPDLLKHLDLPNHPLNLLWPEFLDQDLAAQLFLPALSRIDNLARCQFLAVEKDHVTSQEEIIGMARSMPFFWSELSALGPTDCLADHLKILNTLPDGGYDTILTRGVQQHLVREGLLEPLGSLTNDPPNALSALSIAVRRDRRKSGLAEVFIRKMKQTAIDEGLGALVVPLRPTQKPSYPMVNMNEYIKWSLSLNSTATPAVFEPVMEPICTRLDGCHQQPLTPFDPWLRKHLRMGGRIVKVAHTSMRVRGTAEDWSRWTGIDFKAQASQDSACTDGGCAKIAIPGGLVPVEYRPRQNIGVYVEPNVWIYHQLKG